MRADHRNMCMDIREQRKIEFMLQSSKTSEKGLATLKYPVES